jgi:glycosyltransferase involved in cell wall biosynthesis
VLHSTANLLPLGYRRESVVTIHDLDFIIHPENSPPARRRLFERLTPSTIRRASVIITDSEYSASVILKHYPGVSPEKVRVLHLGVPDPCSVSREAVDAAVQKHELHEGYFLCVGTLEKRKNISQVLEAFYLYRQNYDRPARLVLAGQPGYGYEEIIRAVSASPYQKSIVLTGYVSGEELAALYTGASSLLFLSRAEGFGLPALEAMNYACPVIASRGGALPEICGEGAILVSGQSAEETVEAMADLMADEPMRHALIQRGRENLGRFSWPRHASQLNPIYRELIQG